jgi:arylsulfatase A-like enzyme
MRKSFYVHLATALLLVSQAFAQTYSKPNVVFIAVDDLKPVLGCYGNKLVKSPNIDRLAKMGTVFMSNYCQQAVCGPTRASLMTGMRPDYTKIWDLKTRMRDMNPDIMTIPQHFASQGYVTSGVGKIFHPTCVDKEFDKQSWTIPFIVAGEDAYADDENGGGSATYKNPETIALVAKYTKEAEAKGMKKKEVKEYVVSKIKPSSESIDVPDNAYEDGVNALIAKDQLAKLAKSKKPFFFAVGFHKPHLPFVSPKKYWDMYNRADMPIAEFQEHAANSPEIAYHKSGELRNYTDIPEFATRSESTLNIGLTLEKQKELVHGYYAAVSYTDAQVGILLDQMEALGLMKNTVIILWGDHGWHLGDHDLWEKHSNFEQDTRTPMIIVSPEIKPSKTKAMSEYVDIFPTLCDLSKIPTPLRLDGKSLVPLMMDKKASVKEYAVSQYPRTLKSDDSKKAGFKERNLMGYALRTAQYRYIIWMNKFTSKEPFDASKVYAKELYDYKKDPLEKVSVIGDKDYEAVEKEMHGKMLDFFKAQAKK